MKKNIFFALFFLLGNMQYLFAQGDSNDWKEPLQIDVKEGSEEQTTEEEFKKVNALKEEGLRMINQMGKYVKKLVNPKITRTRKDTIINQCEYLHYNPEENYIEVLANKIKIPYKPVRLYYETIAKLGYARASIDWTEALYVNDFKKGMDGRYYGTATICQTFKGVTKEGKLHIAKNCKNVEVIIEMRYNELLKEDEWVVKLGNIYLSE